MLQRRAIKKVRTRQRAALRQRAQPMTSDEMGKIEAALMEETGRIASELQLQLSIAERKASELDEMTEAARR